MAARYYSVECSVIRVMESEVRYGRTDDGVTLPTGHGPLSPASWALTIRALSHTRAANVRVAAASTAPEWN